SHGLNIPGELLNADRLLLSKNRATLSEARGPVNAGTRECGSPTGQGYAFRYGNRVTEFAVMSIFDFDVQQPLFFGCKKESEIGIIRQREIDFCLHHRLAIGYLHAADELWNLSGI